MTQEKKKTITFFQKWKELRKKRVSDGLDESKDASNTKDEDVLKSVQSRNVNYTFESNRKYYTICVYAFFLILVSALTIAIILNFDKTKQIVFQMIQSVTPFLVAVLIAYLLNPLLLSLDQFLKRRVFHDHAKRLRKVVSVFTVYLLFVGALFVLVVYVFPELIKSLQDLANVFTERAPKVYNRVNDLVVGFEKKYPGVNLDFLESKMQGVEDKLVNYGTTLLTNVIPWLVSLSVGVAKAFINILLAIVISCYMLIDKKSLSVSGKRVIYSILNREHADNFCTMGRECNKIFTGFLIGKAIDSLIIGILCFILMCIFRFPYAILLSVIVGVTNMIPYFGPFIGAVPGCLIYLMIDFKLVIFFALMIFVLQQFDGLYLGPKILGGSVGLKPLWVIFAITIGGAYFGVIGMFLGVPVMAALAYILNTFMDHRLEKKGIHIE